MEEPVKHLGARMPPWVFPHGDDSPLRGYSPNEFKT